MKTAKELKDEYQEKLRYLQDHCEHTDVSGWQTQMWAPGHLVDHKVRICNICGKVVKIKK